MEKTTKEVLHTQGEWIVAAYHTPDHFKKVFPEAEGQNFMVTIRVKNGKLIGRVFGFIDKREEAEANAELICKAVNERQELLECLTLAVKILKGSSRRTAFKYSSDRQRIETAINNAKSI